MSRMQLATSTPLRLDTSFRRARPAHIPERAGWRHSRLSAWSCFKAGPALATKNYAANSPRLCVECCIC